jgi:hypothetical protein
MHRIYHGGHKIKLAVRIRPAGTQWPELKGLVLVWAACRGEVGEAPG